MSRTKDKIARFSHHFVGKLKRMGIVSYPKVAEPGVRDDADAKLAALAEKITPSREALRQLRARLPRPDFDYNDDPSLLY